MAHVLERVVHLRGRQRPATPVRACEALAERDVHRALEQRLEAELRRPADERRADLRVDETRRQPRRALPDHLEILARAVQHPGPVGAEQPLEQRREVERRETVDARRVLAGRDLDQAQLRVVGLLADELRVDRDERCVVERRAE